MITIYHNPRCSKSRQAYELITTVFNKDNEPVEVVDYLSTPLTVQQLREIRQMLGCPVREMIRTDEAPYTELHLDYLETTDDALFQAIAQHPVLLQRPIVVHAGRAVIGRPAENIKILFE
ncbi:arsenate reductase (glutaredoxin) [Paraburkholderia bonniea]|uniref:arsenate reductase (glutaredoxin) n=1 Tax=Paraburkholderia bonniea TaxID=2152891 RepID=UPI001290DB6A|nr:arsenate reductase (glutaredoxin) [Paraburkholderia bonniea]WJF91825.1 arsenate reductase (glutaredoxin) [Paraburkholderia bonniea]WJF95144.1 arsenate reductase (glutaredoxin) [Paraburkholderia bonniea]